MKRTTTGFWLALGAVVLAAACSDDEFIPIVVDAAIDTTEIDAPPAIDAPVVDAPLDASTVVACLTSVSVLTVNENGSGTFDVTLSAQPQGAFTCNVLSGDTTIVTVAPASLNFSPGNFGTPQPVTVTGVDDVDAVDDTASVTVMSAGGPTATVAVTVNDDD